jgi:hypothetical protein
MPPFLNFTECWRPLFPADLSDKRWLEGQLKHAGEPSLKERLMDVLSALPLGFERKRMEVFCKSCADRRNDMSHFGGQREGSDYRQFMIDLVKKSEALAYLYHAVLLTKSAWTPP